ncbi:hypothetical protein [Nocardioides pacificus]
MTWLRLVRGELRKLATTRMPWGFLVALLVISGTTAVAVLVGTDMDGSKGFIAGAEDQRSLVAFSFNAMIGTSLFGAIASAREYAHHTVVPTFLLSPRRERATLAQLTAIMLGGGLLGAVGTALTIAAVAVSLPLVDHEFLVPAGEVARLLVASTFTGAVGAVLGGGLGTILRNPGGAVTAAMVLLFILPPTVAQLAGEAADWVPSTLANTVSGTLPGPGPGVTGAVLALLLWALVPALAAVASVRVRDVA